MNSLIRIGLLGLLAMPLIAFGAEQTDKQDKSAQKAKPLRYKAAFSDKLMADGEKLYRDSFREDNLPEWMDRLEQDEVMGLCSRTKDNPPKALAAKLEAAQRALVKYPANGKLMGDWKIGAQLANNGRGGHVGFIQPDPKGIARGGNCYSCHELAKKEVAFGTIGPSLQHFGKIRGYGPDVQKYAYEKIYNSRGYNLCTNMPRFGPGDWLTQEEVTHLVAFLMDPESPVNKD